MKLENDVFIRGSRKSAGTHLANGQKGLQPRHRQCQGCYSSNNCSNKSGAMWDKNCLCTRSLRILALALTPFRRCRGEARFALETEPERYASCLSRWNSSPHLLCTTRTKWSCLRDSLGGTKLRRHTMTTSGGLNRWAGQPAGQLLTRPTLASVLHRN